MSPLRRRLFVLAAAALVPLAITAAMGLGLLVQHQRDEAKRAGIELTRALATAVDAELGRSVAVVQAVATSPTLEAGELAEFHRRVARVVASQSHWHAIQVLDGEGHLLLDTRVPYGAPLPTFDDPETLARLQATRVPAAGNLQPNADERASPYHFSVQVPVVRDDVLRYVVVALVEPAAIRAILDRQHVPPDWVISIFDAAGRRVARSRAHEENLGTPGAPSVVALMSGPEPEGWGLTTALEGDPVYTAYSRVKAVGWTVATGIPRALVDGAVWRSARVFGGGFAASIAIGVFAAILVGRGITESMAALARAARALGRREPVAAPATPIAEIRQVGEALAAAGEERARFEREREELLVREREARAAAEAANRAKDEFLAMLGHELRNPLGAVATAVALLDRPGLTAEAGTKARAIITRQTANLARLTDDLLDAGRVITGKIVLERRPVDLAEVAGRALGAVETRGHRVSRLLTSVWVHGDATRLEQVVVNLVTNAVKYTPESGAIRLVVDREADDAVLRVSDEGIGMTPELRARVFELFVQGERPLDRGSGGLGIGLTLVRRLAELHGGSATAASAGLGHGTEMTVRLPAIPAPPDVGVTPARAPSLGAGRDVLVVEDNEDARAALAELLQLAGHRVRTEADGVAGLAAALARPPEVALVDVGLPGLDGYEVARRIRASGAAGRGVRLVALTGYGAPEDRQRALDAGFDRHLVKPVSLAALAEVLAG